jgi:hypothetical protein
MKDQVRSTEEALDLAQEALEICEQHGYIPVRLTRDAITAIKQARSAPVQEPEHIVHSNGRYSPLLTRMMNKRVESNVKQVICLYDEPAPVQEPVAWRYTDARGHYRYRGYVPGFDAEYQLLKPEALCLCATTPPAQTTPVQDSTCSETLRAQGKAYPRTCRKCGLGPCIGAPKQPPAQPAPAPGYCKHCKQYSIEEPLPAAQRQCGDDK